MSVVRLLLLFGMLCHLLWIGLNIEGWADHRSSDAFEFMAFGDMPYERADFANFARLTDYLNQAKPAFSVHVGDIKAGDKLCSDRNFKKVKDLFDRFEHPLVYTPGDNEWTDCHRLICGGYKPAERLAKLRTMFFKDDIALEGMVRQADEQPEYAEYVENLQWQIAGVQFATLHVVGSNNNRQRNRKAKAEYKRRNAANLSWANDAFDRAESTNAPGIVFFMHAETRFGYDKSDRSGFVDLHQLFEDRSKGYDGQVLLVHGDNHFFKVDKPLRDSKSYALIKNFTRVNIFGSPDTQAVRIRVDSHDPDVFTVKPFLH